MTPLNRMAISTRIRSIARNSTTAPIAASSRPAHLPMPEPFPKGTAPATDTMVCDMHYSRDGQPPDKCATVLHGPHPLKLFLMGAESASGPRLGDRKSTRLNSSH